MLFIKLNDLETVNNLCKLGEKYKDNIDIDVSYGRQIVDARSVLGVTSLIGNIVKITPLSDDSNAITQFSKDLCKIGGYEV